MIVAIDANVIAFAVTGKPHYQAVAQNWLDSLERSKALVVTSALSRLECFVRPHRLGRPVEEALYQSFFERVVSIPIGDDMLNLAAHIRAGSRSFRTPDAIHLASAQIAQVDFFLTADRRLKAYRSLRVAYALIDTPGMFIS